MIILMAVGMYQVTGSFRVGTIAQHHALLILHLPGVFAGFLYILIIKFRKSPFDLSMSHHAHQEIVRGITTEFSGPALAIIEITHWYETVLLLGMVYLFFAFTPWLALFIALATYLFVILIDMNYARLKWQITFLSAWVHGRGRGIQHHRAELDAMTARREIWSGSDVHRGSFITMPPVATAATSS